MPGQEEAEMSTSFFRVFRTAGAVALALALFSSTAIAEELSDEELMSGVKKQERVRYAFSGQKMRLASLYVAELDCSAMEGISYEIIKKPEHGVAELVPQAFFPTFAKNGPLVKCNEKRVDGFALNYRPNAGYRGPDSLTYVVITPTGFAYEYAYRFNVRELPPSTLGPKKRGA